MSGETVLSKRIYHAASKNIYLGRKVPKLKGKEAMRDLFRVWKTTKLRRSKRWLHLPNEFMFLIESTTRLATGSPSVHPACNCWIRILLGYSRRIIYRAPFHDVATYFPSVNAFLSCLSFRKKAPASCHSATTDVLVNIVSDNWNIAWYIGPHVAEG